MFPITQKDWKIKSSSLIIEVKRHSKKGIKHGTKLGEDLMKKGMDKYKRAKNEYVAIHRGEERKYEKNVVNKFKEEPELFYKFMNRKVRVNNSIPRLEVRNVTNEMKEEMCEIMNDRLQTVFTTLEDFVQPEIDRRAIQMEEILVNPELLLKIMKELM